MNLYERATKIFSKNGAAVAAQKMPNQAESTATTVAALKEDVNTLLAALKNAGLMESDS